MGGGYGRRSTIPLLRPIQKEDVSSFFMLPLKLFVDLYDVFLYIHSRLPTILVMLDGTLAYEHGLCMTAIMIALIKASARNL